MWDWKKGVLVRVAGEGGEGVISCGDMIARAMGRLGLDIFTFRTYPAEIKGGPAMNQVRGVSGKALSQGDKLDVLVAFNTEACHLHLKDLREGGVLVYDPMDWQDDPTRDIHRLPVHLQEITAEVKSRLSKNVAALGAAGKTLGFPVSVLEHVVAEKFSRKSEEVLAKNLDAMRIGFDRVDMSALPSAPPELVELARNESLVVMSGNEALVLGALTAGVSYYAGYPITPASDIMEGLAARLPRLGGVVLQTEDEVSALASCLGASYSGAKSMTATSGPGFSLMVELMGYSVMAEIPVVIVDCQRGGPSTGLPTKVEQSDLDLAIFGGHGEAPRIVLAPGNVEDCFYTIVQAFNMAEKYQCPVVVLSDQALATRTQEFQKPDLASIQIEHRLVPTPEELKDYKRYRDTSSGVSPMAIPGTPGGEYISTGLEHGEDALPKYTGENHSLMMAKRWRKIQPAASEPGLVKRYGAAKSTVGIITWGSNEGVCREAVQNLAEEGLDVGLLQVKLLNPLPEEQIAEFLNDMEAIVVPEMNFSGMFARILRSAFMRPFTQLNKTMGLPFTAQEICEAVKEVWNSGKDNSGLQVGSETDLVSGLR